MLNQQKFKNIIFALMLLIVVTGVVGYVYVYQRNIFGEDRVRFEIEASEKVEVGEKMNYTLRYRNNSDVRLENVKLFFEYPDNVKPIEEDGEEDVIIRGDLRREINVGELNPGEEKVTRLAARPFGEEGSLLRAEARIRYIPKNLTSRYQTEREHLVEITGVPVDFYFDLPSVVSSGDQEVFRLLLSSNISYPLEDLEIRADYPDGFNLRKSSPVAKMDGNNRWGIPVINQGESKAIDIEGSLSGNPGDSKIFGAALGIWIRDDFVTLKDISRGVSIFESDIFIDARVNEERDYIASPGELLHYQITYKNIGERTLEDLSLLVELDRETLDFDKVEVIDGIFQKNRGLIIWSEAFGSGISSLRAGEEGVMEFLVEAKEDLPRNPEIEVSASLEGESKKISTKVATVLSFDQEIVREGSPFGEMGPFPFEEGEKSNYAVKWTMRSSFNDIEDVEARTWLPEGAEITEKIKPEEVGISFNASTGEVLIEMKELSAGTGKEIFFEVEIEPQREPQEEKRLTGEAAFSGKDSHTGRSVEKRAEEIFLEDLLEKYGY